MAQRVTRHRLHPDDPTATIRHQRHALPVHFGFISGAPFIWVMESDGEATRRYRYTVVATGDDLPDGLEYMKSTTDHTGLTAHLFRGAF